MKKRGNQDFPFNDVSSEDNRLGVELARPAEQFAMDHKAAGASTPQDKLVSKQNANRPMTGSDSQSPKRFEDFSSLYEPPKSASARPAQSRENLYPQNSADRTNRYDTPLRPRQPSYSGDDAYTRAPVSRKRTLNRQIQILSIIAGIMFIICLILLGFAIFGGRKGSATDPVSGGAITSLQQNTTDSPLDSTAPVNQTTSATTLPTPEVTTTAPDADPQSFVNLPPSQENPVIALTFDDGPSGTLTSELLDVLKEKGVHVTFFLLGCNVADQDPALLKRMIDEGHEIGNHSYDHSIYTELTDDQIRSQLQKTNDLIFDAVGIYPKVMRPPTGGCNDNVLAVSKEMGMATVNWSWESCPEDWLKDHQTPEFISNHVITNAANGHIVLLHDIHECTVDSISAMIDGLKAKGYRFATCSELLGTLPNGMETGKLYYYGTA